MRKRKQGKVFKKGIDLETRVTRGSQAVSLGIKKVQSGICCGPDNMLEPQPTNNRIRPARERSKPTRAYGCLTSHYPIQCGCVEKNLVIVFRVRSLFGMRTLYLRQQPCLEATSEHLSCRLGSTELYLASGRRCMRKPLALKNCRPCL